MDTGDGGLEQHSGNEVRDREKKIYGTVNSGRVGRAGAAG